MMMPDEDALILCYYGLDVHYRTGKPFSPVGPETITFFFHDPEIQYPLNLGVEDFIRIVFALTSDAVIPGIPDDWFERVTFDHWLSVRRPETDRLIRPEGEIAATPPVDRLDWLIELPSEDGMTTFAPLTGVLNALLQVCDEGYLPPLPEGWFEEALPAEHRQDFDRGFEAKGRWLRKEGEDPLQALLGDKLSPLPPRKDAR